MKRWQPVDWIVLILALAIASGILVTVISPFVLGEPITEARSKILSTIITAIVAVVSVYVGNRIRAGSDDD